MTEKDFYRFVRKDKRKIKELDPDQLFCSKKNSLTCLQTNKKYEMVFHWESRLLFNCFKLLH